ncbi:ATP-binding protein [Burkholderia sp. Tr-862]|uniref:ATP-binding protein n=1 Tax=Burkholderia sp. Tr-862 TaxID=2608331 RepID=UPI0032B37E68
MRDARAGVAPEHVERLFESFYTTKASGMRMGLSICRSIIDAHGGLLWASANAPRDAIFQFMAPLHPRRFIISRPRIPHRRVSHRRPSPPVNGYE